MAKNFWTKLSTDNKSVSDGGELSVCGNAIVEHVKDNSCGCACNCDDESGSTKIIAEVDIGFGNILYVRGAGCGLNWGKGVAMQNKDTKFWVFDTKNGKCDFEYKLLINDEIWSTGENFTAKCCRTNVVKPTF